VSISLRARIFICLPPAVARRRAIQSASGLTYLSADSIAPVALWEVRTKVFRHASVLEVESERDCFTNHGLHMNSRGKEQTEKKSKSTRNSGNIK
jgi:hypothetical protein